MRVFMASIISISVVFILFYAMLQLLQQPQAMPEQASLDVDFIALPKEPEPLQKRERPVPEKSGKQPPPPLQMPVVAAVKGQPILPKLDPIKPAPFKFSSEIGNPTLSKLHSAPVQKPVPTQNTTAQGTGTTGTGLGKVKVIKHPKAVYPTQALLYKKEGKVVLKFTITTQGIADNIQIVESNPKGLFDQAAIQALKQWRFEPAFINGKPVERSNVIETFDFIIQR